MIRRVVIAAFVVAVSVGTAGGCDGQPERCAIVREGIARCGGGLDSSPFDAPGVCNVLAQTGCAVGEKCTWLVDNWMPQYIGHIGCAPNGTAELGEACVFGAAGATGYDNCSGGSVCNAHASDEVGACVSICDPQGGSPTCDAQHTCVIDAKAFRTIETPPPAGVCEPACDPLADNDFDGSGSVLSRTGSACGSDATLGCYGYPSAGTPPKTEWACMRDKHYLLSLRHRVQCAETNGCADSVIAINACNQGYLPLLYESTGTSTVICVALCKPKNCYAGNCGTNDDDRLGEAPHRCTTTDRLGTFDTSANGEHCRYLWSLELDQQGNFLRSPSSDTVGFCFDHSKYEYDSDNDNTPDTTYPPCASLPDGFGSGSALGAADIGCVDTTHVNLATGKAHRVLGDVRPLD